jgi:Na+/H+ antiporter NhaD/arsenite permease-like protein
MSSSSSTSTRPIDRLVHVASIGGVVAIAVLSVIALLSGGGHETDHESGHETGHELQATHDGVTGHAEASAEPRVATTKTDIAPDDSTARELATEGTFTTADLPPVHGPHHLWWLGTVPFVALLLAIAILPLVPATARWWESNTHRLAVAVGLAFLTLAFLLATGGRDAALAAIEHAIPGEYVPFIVLLFSLYVVSGGIAILGDFRPTPAVNTGFLIVGTAIASAIGTTGASMLLIWPLLRANANRRHRVHTVVFFIFLVANIGGTLLPTGDPPLFLGYLRGVPFLWTLSLWPAWLLASGVLLATYFVWDTMAFRREVPEIRAWRPAGGGVRILGGVNLLLLVLVVLTVATVQEGRPFPLLGFETFPFLRELIMLGLVGASLGLTPRAARDANRFNYHAIVEVACLFVGIFITMQVPLEVLKASGGDLGLERATSFFWVTGVLSSFLDNAPTYLVFFQTAESLSREAGAGILQLAGGEFIREDLLEGISLGAVFMGAMTYIGNGPNFMVRSIAEQSGIRMPSFFGYMLYSGAILMPLMVVIALLFLT